MYQRKLEHLTKMRFHLSILLSLLASSAEAHFRVPFPGERNATNWDTQTTSPCGGDNSVVLPRYEWNPKGSPIEINYHHSFGVGAIYFCGSGNCTTGADFDELIYEPVDQTVGNFCIPAVQLPDKYNKVNSTGVIQIIYGTPGKKDGDYEFMYNCVDVIVSEDGPTFNGQCSNSTNFAEFDTQVAALEAKNNDEQIDKISSFSYLEKVIVSTAKLGSASSRASATTSAVSGKSTSTSMDMEMGGMSDMDGMPGMDMETTTGRATASSGTTAEASASVSASVTASASVSASASESGSKPSSTKVSTAGGSALSCTSGFVLLALFSLLS